MAFCPTMSALVRWLSILAVGALLVASVPGGAFAAAERPSWSVGDYWEFVGWDRQIGITVNLTERVEVLAFEPLVRVEGTYETVKVLRTQTQVRWWSGVNVTVARTQWFSRADLSILRDHWVLTSTPPGTTTLDITIEYTPPWLLYRFPFSAGAAWTTDSRYTVTGVPPNTTFFVPYASDHHVLSEADYTIPGGSGADANRTFHVYLLQRTNPGTGGVRWLDYWSDEVGFWVRHEMTASNGTGLQELTLTSHQVSAASLGSSVPLLGGLALLVAALVALGTDRGRHAASRWFVMPLYTRLKKEEVLDQFTRGRVFGYIEAHPGAAFSDILRELRLPHGSLMYHVSVLEREGLVRSRVMGTRRLLFAASAEDEDGPLSAIQGSVLKQVEEAPGLSISELGGRLSMTRQLALYHARQLGLRGRLTLRRSGLTLRCYPTQSGPFVAPKAGG